MMNLLKDELEKHNIEYSETLFTDVADLEEDPYVSAIPPLHVYISFYNPLQKSEARIFIWTTYPLQAKQLACEVYTNDIACIYYTAHRHTNVTLGIQTWFTLSKIPVSYIWVVSRGLAAGLSIQPLSNGLH